MLHERILVLVQYVTEVLAGEHACTLLSGSYVLIRMNDQAKRKKTTQHCAHYLP